VRKQKIYEKLWGCLDKNGVGQCKGFDLLEMLKDEDTGMRVLDMFTHTQGG